MINLIHQLEEATEISGANQEHLIKVREADLKHRLLHAKPFPKGLTWADDKNESLLWLPPRPFENTEADVKALAFLTFHSTATKIKEMMQNSHAFDGKWRPRISCLWLPSSDDKGLVVVRFYAPRFLQMQMAPSGFTWTDDGEKHVRGGFELNGNALGIQGFQTSTGRTWSEGRDIPSFQGQRELWSQQSVFQEAPEGSDPLNGR